MKKLISTLIIFSLGCGTESRKEPSQPQAPIPTPQIQASVASPIGKDVYDPSKPPASEHERIVLQVTGIQDKITIETLYSDTAKINLTKEAFHLAQILFPKNDVPKLIFYRQTDTGTSFSKEYPLNRIAQNINGDPLYQSDDHRVDNTIEHEDCVERTITHPIYEVSKTNGKWYAFFKFTEMQRLLPLNEKGVHFKNKAQELFSPTLSLPEVQVALKEERLFDLKPHEIEKISREIMIEAYEEPLEKIKKNKKSKKYKKS